MILLYICSICLSFSYLQGSGKKKSLTHGISSHGDKDRKKITNTNK